MERSRRSVALCNICIRFFFFVFPFCLRFVIHGGGKTKSNPSEGEYVRRRGSGEERSRVRALRVTAYEEKERERESARDHV